MDRATFWSIIAAIDWRADDVDRVLLPARVALADQSADRIHEFQDVLAELLFALDTRRHADTYSDGAVLTDDFLYARCGVVANGRDYYDSVLEGRVQIRSDLDFEFEELLYLAPHAYSLAGGDGWEHDTAVSWETFSNAAGWEAPSGAVRLPRLRVLREAGRTVEDPTAAYLLDLLGTIESGIAGSFLIVQRLGDEGGELYAQTARLPDGSYAVEYRDGGAERHYATTVPDQRGAYRLLVAWSRRAEGWADGASWIRLEF